VARNFAELSLYFTQHFWSSGYNCSSNFHFAKAIEIAMNKKMLSLGDLYLNDLELMEKIAKCEDDEIQTMLAQSKNPEVKIYKKGYHYEKYPIIIKFRGVDPLVLTPTGSLKRLTEVDIMFKNYYEHVKKQCDKILIIDRICKSNR
jgi:Sec7-like guanine-nucleotide exchange factor